MSEKRINKKNGSPGKTGSPSMAKTGPMDLPLLEQLVKLMADNGLSTVELTDGEQRILLKRGGDAIALPSATSYGYPPPSAAPQAGGASQSKSVVPDDADESQWVAVKSPMPGTFYAASAKGNKPFVTIGAKVEEETDVCIVEAMKVFNTIKAECRGSIAKILVHDSQPVEFGQVLFLVRPG